MQLFMLFFTVLDVILFTVVTASGNGRNGRNNSSIVNH